MTYSDDLLDVWHVELLVEGVEGAAAEGPELVLALGSQVGALLHSLLLFLDCLSDFLFPVFL